jgi:uncharacterized membrane protein
MVPEKEVIELDMTVEEGLKMIISMGVVVPEVKKQMLTQSNNDASSAQTN